MQPSGTDMVRTGSWVKLHVDFHICVLWLTVAFSCPPTGYANFLSGLHYWKLDPVELKVLEGYPRSIGMDFFGCHSV